MVRRQRAAVRAGATALALVVLACSGPEASEVPSATDRCGEVVFPPLQFGSHLIGDRDPPVPYSSVPPTSGWHGSGAPAEGIHTTPLSEPAQVLVLEAGGVVVTHHDLPDGDVARLHEVASSPGFTDRVVVTPYEEIDPGTTAFTSWGAMQLCDGLDLTALEAYVGTYADPISTHD
jgi:hypothetical protein